MQKINTADGLFVDGNPSTGVPGTILNAVWLNMVQAELISVLTTAGIVVDGAKSDQLATAIRLLSQQAGSTYGADTGAANAYTVAYSPAITALTSGMVLRFAAVNANTGASTFAPNGLAAKPVIGLALQALQGGEIAASGRCVVMYSATLDSWILLSSAGGAQQVASATKSQHALALGQATGRLLNVQVFTASGTYTPTPGTTKIIVEAVGGGGAGAGSVATSNASSCGGGGGGGAYCKALFTAVPASVAVTIGAGGAPASAAAGGAGGTTTFGAYLSVSGGGGGAASAAVAGANAAACGSGGTAISTTGIELMRAQGSSGSWGIVWTLGGNALGGAGGASAFGPGGNVIGAASPGAMSVTNGGGGGGTCNANTGAALTGGAGKAGIVIVYEYGTAAAVA